MPSSAAALSRAYATATLRPSNRCCTGPLYSGGGSGGVGVSGGSGGGGGGCGYQYGTVGRSRSPRDLSPSALVRQRVTHLSSTGSPPKGPPNNNNGGNNINNNNNNACLVQYDAHSATLPRCSSANVVCTGQNSYDEPAATNYGGSHAATRRISSSCIRESSALACCSTAAYSGHAALSGVKSAAAATSTTSTTATSTPSAVAAAVAAAAAATSTPSTTTQASGSGSGGGNNNNNNNNNAHCPPAQPNNASW